MLKKSLLQELYASKNLLAFSAGGDSTALLFLLLENKIEFDIAIVDYGIREQSKEENSYAKKLAKEYNFKCFTLHVDKITSNFEANARNIRYNFFEKIIRRDNYTNLLTAHHLGDRFEWMLMQFCKGAGCAELSGMRTIEERDDYKLLRPLLHLEKQELLHYLKRNSLNYFEDASNKDEQYTRNYFRHKHTTPLLHQYLSGIKKSFEYIDEDVEELLEYIPLNILDDFVYFKSSKSKRSDIFHIDKYLKSLGFLLSASERQALKQNTTLIVSRKIVINQTKNFVFIAPYIITKSMRKQFKEKMRRLKIEPKLRAYLHENPKAEALITSLLS